jgi:hypothetical protein
LEPRGVGSARMCCGLVAAVVVVSLTGCSASSSSKPLHTVSVEVVDVGVTDTSAPGATQLARLAKSTKCTAWARNPISQGEVDIVIKLLVTAKPGNDLIRTLNKLANVRSVAVSDTSAVPPTAVGESIAPHRVPCGKTPI